MSDCVRFGTTNDTVTPDQSSGFNGFPFPYQKTGTTGAGTPNPVGMNFREAMKLWWRVKNFSFSSTWSMVVSGTTYTFSSGNMTPVPGLRSTELDMIHTANDLEFNAVGSQALQFQLTVPFINSTGDETGTIYPQFTFTINLQTPSGLSAPFIQFLTQDTGGSIGNFSADFDGFTLTMYYYYPNGTPDSVTPGNILIEPVEYWPYAGSAGGTNPGDPIYDTTTGAELLPPTT